VKLVEGLNHRKAVLLPESSFNSKEFTGFEFIFDAGCLIH
jgi:hypothetical protein